MRDWIFKPNRANRYIVNWLALDSWIDSTLYGLYARFKDWWANYNNFFARFRVSGFRRFATEIVSDVLTLGTAGAAVVLMFELPAIELTKNPNWRTGSEFSVTFLDRYGNEVGKRGIQFSDAVPLEEIPDNLIKATMATEDRRFFDHFGIDIFGTFRAVASKRPRGTGGPGRQFADAAAREEFVPVVGTLASAQNSRSLSCALARVPPDEERDSETLS